MLNFTDKRNEEPTRVLMMFKSLRSLTVCCLRLYAAKIPSELAVNS